MTTEKSTEQVDLTNGDDKADSKAEEDKTDEDKTDEDKTDEDKPDEDKTDETKTDEAKADEGKPEESDSTDSRKRPHEDEEGVYLLVKYYVSVLSYIAEQDQKETPKKPAKDTPYEMYEY